MAAPMLVDQPAYQHRLRQERRADHENLSPVSLPCSQFAEVNCTSGQQNVFADAPASHLAPVVFWRCKSNRWRLDIARVFAGKDTKSNADGETASLLDRKQWTADDPLAEIDIVITEYRGIGDCIKSGEDLDVLVRRARRIGHQHEIENSRSRRKRRGTLQH